MCNCYFFLTKISAADDGGCKELVFNELNHLPHTIESYPFRVWYATEGKNALGNQSVNLAINNRPTVINDLLLQLHSADKYFSQKLELVQPLLQKRYKKAEFIDVYLIAMGQGNGSAFDEVIAGRKSNHADKVSCSIKIHINKNNQPSFSITPAHELFHLYQYSNSMFKASWYLEGMTRWVERAFVGVKTRDLKAITPSSCSDVYQEKYSASRYWQDLAKRKSSNDILIDEDFLQLKYSDGRSVFNNSVFKNGGAAAEIFNELEKESLNLSKSLKLPPYRWPENLQRSPKFNNNICRAVDSW